MKPKDYSKAFIWICSGITFFCVLIYWSELKLNIVQSQRYASKLELLTQDWRTLLGRKVPVDPRIVYIGVDQENYTHMYPPGTIPNHEIELIRRQWPWSREVWAILCEKLIQSGAKVVGLDLIFPASHEKFPEGDQIFQKVLLKYSHQIVLGLNIVTETFRSGMSSTLNEQNFTIQYPASSIVGTPDDPITNQIWNNIAFVNIWPDSVDGVLRNAYYSLSDPNIIPLHSLAKKMITRAGEEEISNALPSSTRFRFSYNPKSQSRFSTDHSHTFKSIPLYQILDPKFWERNFDSGKFFKDKIILIGPQANFFQDKHQTPYPETMPGPKIHLSFINAALHGEFVEETSRITDILTIILFGILALLFCRKIEDPRNRAFLLIFFNILFAGSSILIYDWFNLYILCFLPFLTLNSSVFICDLYEILAERKERARVRSHLERYVSKNVVKMLLENPQQLQGRKTVTILFSDLRGFTTLTESADAEQLVKQLNEYLSKMVKCVFQNKGTLDKFIGDAVMAVWGNAETEGTEIDAQRAVQCALDMIEELRKLNQKWIAEGKNELKVGIGINHGQAIVGNMGSDDKAYERMEFTVIGDSVNTASRLEGLTKEYHSELLLGETVEPLVDQAFLLRSVALVQLKGKNKPIEVFGVLGKIDAQNPIPKPQWLTYYENAMHAYRKRDFKEALSLFEKANSLLPQDYLIEQYIESCQEFIQHPPDEKWTGVIVMKTK